MYLSLKQRAGRLWPEVHKEKEGHSQLLLHFLEGGFGLFEEALDYAATECLLIVALIHLKNLLESRLVDVIAINNRWWTSAAGLRLRLVACPKKKKSGDCQPYSPSSTYTYPFARRNIS